jgi:hypothetical protein
VRERGILPLRLVPRTESAPTVTKAVKKKTMAAERCGTSDIVGVVENCPCLFRFVQYSGAQLGELALPADAEPCPADYTTVTPRAPLHSRLEARNLHRMSLDKRERGAAGRGATCELGWVGESWGEWASERIISGVGNFPLVRRSAARRPQKGPQSS